MAEFGDMSSIAGYWRAVQALLPIDADSIGQNEILKKHHHKHHRPMSPREAERQFLTIPTAESARNASHSFTFQHHIAGTDQDRQSALRVKAQWESLLGLKQSKPDANVYEAGSEESRRALTGEGYTVGGSRLDKRRGKAVSKSSRHFAKPRVWVDTYWPLLNYPVSRSLKMLAPDLSRVVYEAKLDEDVLQEDPTSSKGPLTFHGFAKSGKVTGQLVYAGLGRKEDFDELSALGVDFKDKIVIVQYGGVFRGLKVLEAAKKGAAGVLIYTDPIEDGEVTVEKGYKPYPHGPARQPSSVQRGSVQALSIYPGDPLTPGKPAYKNAERLERNGSASNIPTIPSLPISYSDAIPLLRALNGHGIQRTGTDGHKEGSLGFAGVQYFTGPSPEFVELNVEMDDKVTKIWNTYAIVPGHIESEVVVLGNHNDAWSFGSADPNSGTAAVHEVVKAFGHLLKNGWKPMRTILLASWDAEEYGLIGSTEFGEDYSAWLKQHVVGYLNIDVGTAGTFYGLGASPSMADLLRNVSDVVEDPAQPGHSLRERARHGQGEDGVASTSVAPSGDLSIGPLGSGSDFTVFLQYLGLASGNVGFSRSKTDPIYMYHSLYDSAAWMDKFGDPTFKYHEAISKVLGLTALRLTDSIILPLNVTAYAYELEAYARQVPALLTSLPKDHQDSIDLSPLFAVIKRIQIAAHNLDREGDQAKAELERLLRDGFDMAGKKGRRRRRERRHREAMMRVLRRIQSVNRKLRLFEGTFIDEEGLSGRTWYKSLVVAPGRYRGYGAAVLPGLTESLTLDKDVNAANHELSRLVRALTSTVNLLTEA
ncbi:Vacuolar protein sorting-associated protein 70 [Microbotryomycetes sp. JL221]|nr:Vacuolar protein sorting-associated protein 70 [Microbotryomycetes sp. JL221]